MPVLLARSFLGFFRQLWDGEPGAWIAVGGILVFILGMAIAEKFFGFKVLDKKTRRRAKRKRRPALWEYERDDE